MKIGRLLTLFALCLLTTTATADIELKATYTDKKGVEVVATDNFNAEAPLYVEFTSNPSNLDPAASIEWQITNSSAGINVTRYEENTSYTFTAAGKNTITLNVVLDGDVIDTKTITITISDSHLEMPNAFSPNGDGINDYFQAKTIPRLYLQPTRPEALRLDGLVDRGAWMGRHLQRPSCQGRCLLCICQGSWRRRHGV